MPDIPVTRDALASPAPEDIAESIYGLVDQGAAWGTPDGESLDRKSVLARFWLSVADPLAKIYTTIFTVAGESTVCTINNSLVDWEVEYGLPDPCLGADPSRAIRLKSLAAKVGSSGTITSADFIALANAYGYSITIEEPHSFECAISECGETSDQLGSFATVDAYWIVHVGSAEELRFECSVSECGLDRLLDFANAACLEKLFLTISSAHFKPVFYYS